MGPPPAIKISRVWHLFAKLSTNFPLACLHWLRVPERIEFKIAVYDRPSTDLRRGISQPFHVYCVADLASRRSLRSVGTNRLVVPTNRLLTVGSRAFPVAGPQTWNDLPEDETSAESLTTFRRLLKTHLSRKSFPDYLLNIKRLSPVDLAVGPLLRPLIDWSIDWLVDV